MSDKTIVAFVADMTVLLIKMDYLFKRKAMLNCVTVIEPRDKSKKRGFVKINKTLTKIRFKVYQITQLEHNKEAGAYDRSH